MLCRPFQTEKKELLCLFSSIQYSLPTNVGQFCRSQLNGMPLSLQVFENRTQIICRNVLEERVSVLNFTRSRSLLTMT